MFDSKTIIFDNEYDNDDNIARVVDHNMENNAEYAMFIREKDASGKVISVKKIKTFTMNQKSSIRDYFHNRSDSETNATKNMSPAMKYQLANYPEVKEEDFRDPLFSPIKMKATSPIKPTFSNGFPK
jgi:hypothetical protein